MNELIRMDGASEFPVSGRELHERLGIETPYHIWFPRMCEYGFEAGKDFQTMNKNVQRADGTIMPKQQTDHQLTLSMAKELCMIQRTEQGREVRRYLIRVEEAWNSPDAIMARALTIANDRVKELTGQVLKLEASNSELTVQTQIMRPKAEYFDELVDRNLLTSFRETAKQLHVKERAFVDFLLSEDAQKLVADAYLLPGRSDVQCENRTNLSDIPQIPTDWTKMMGVASDTAAKLNSLCK